MHSSEIAQIVKIQTDFRNVFAIIQILDKKIPFAKSLQNQVAVDFLWSSNRLTKTGLLTRKRAER